MNNIKKLFIVGLATVAISGITASKSMSYTGTVDKETVRLREEASTSSDILANLDYGDKVEIISEDGDWYKVKFKTYEGFMYKEYIKTENSDAQSNSSSDNEEEDESNSQTQVTSKPTIEPKPTEEVDNEPEQTPIATPSMDSVSHIGEEIVLKNDVSVYLLPVITSSITGSIQAETKIKVIQETNNWIKVTSAKKSGWIFKAVISEDYEPSANEEPKETQVPEATDSPEPTPEVTPEVVATAEPTSEPNQTENSNKGFINVANANIREKASTTADVIASLTEKTEVTILGEENDFYKISTSTLKEGYVAKRLVTLDTVTSRSGAIREEKEETSQNAENMSIQENIVDNEVNTIEAQEIVNFAEQFLGYDYVYGGTSPENGFDCSGYTYYVYNNNGVEIARDLVSQASIGSEVSEDEIEIGDLIIFQDDSMSGIGHSGIYIGNGEFIHAANPSRGVVTDSINNSYYNPRIVTIRRVV